MPAELCVNPLQAHRSASSRWKRKRCPETRADYVSLSLVHNLWRHNMVNDKGVSVCFPACCPKMFELWELLASDSTLGLSLLAL